MPLVNMRDMLNHAHRNNYAVGGFEIVSLDFLDAILQAAESCRAPVILNMVAFHFDHYKLELLLSAAEKAAKQSSVPVSLHLDHCSSQEMAIRGINLGCNSLMMDAAHKSFPVNVAQTRQMVDIAHACGVSVEAEVGFDDTIVATEHTHHHDNGLTPVEEARALVARTSVDCLTVSIGTHHGRVQGRIKLDMDRLKRIHEAVKIPLVIHGGSGLNDDQYRKLISQGVARINYSTALRNIAGEHLRNNAHNPSNVDYLGIMTGVRDTIRCEVERCMRSWGSAGRAAEVLVQCEPWKTAEHVITYNMEKVSDSQIEHIMTEGRKILGRIPGVRRVFSGWSVSEDTRFRCCWLLQLVHARVIDSYRNHPDHVAFTNLLRPVAAELVSMDFTETRPDHQVKAVRTL